MIKILSEFDKEKFKLRLHVQLSNIYKENTIIITIAILSMGVIIATENNYKNQFPYIYSIALLLMLSFAQIQTVFYGQTLNYFCRLNFNRKHYYLGNILILLVISSITSIVFLISIVINKIVYNRQQIVCFLCSFSRINFISIIQIIILSFVITTMTYLFANLIVIICIGKQKRYTLATLILSLILLILCASYTFGQTRLLSFISISVFNIYNKDYWVYLIILVIAVFLEYYIGKKLFMKKDID